MTNLSSLRRRRKIYFYVISVIIEETKALWRHKKVKHVSEAHSATELHGLKNNKEMMHEGIRYYCDQCEYTASHLSLLKRHKESR